MAILESTRDRRDGAARCVAAALAFAGWTGLSIQIVMYVHWMGPLRAIAVFFAFFTLPTNLLVAAVLTAYALRPRDQRGPMAGAAVSAAATVYIVVVGSIYAVLLRATWHPRGILILTNALMHYVTPVGYPLFWILFAEKRGLRWRLALWWLIYPIAYMGWVLCHGGLSNWYPYTFLDVKTEGVSRLLVVDRKSVV